MNIYASSEETFVSVEVDFKYVNIHVVWYYSGHLIDQTNMIDTTEF